MFMPLDRVQRQCAGQTGANEFHTSHSGQIDALTFQVLHAAVYGRKLPACCANACIMLATWRQGCMLACRMGGDSSLMNTPLSLPEQIATGSW